jgi:cell filamentation protein
MKWAGELRQNTGTMKKQRKAGPVVSYGDSAYVQSALVDVFKKNCNRRTSYAPLPPTSFATRAALHHEIDPIHPFREGNSRTLRQFFGDLANEAGDRIDWTAASATEEDRQQIFLARVV